MRLSLFAFFAVLLGAMVSPKARAMEPREPWARHCGPLLVTAESPRWLRSPRILLVGDFHGEEAEFLAELRAAGLEPEVRIIGGIDHAAFGERWNLLVVAENPERPLAAALVTRMREQRRRVPFFVWVGSSLEGRRLGVAAMTMGAVDVLSTLDPTRWAPAVLRELRSAHHRWQTRRAMRGRLLAREEEKALFDRAEDVLFIGTVRGRIQRINPAFERIFGYAPQETLAMPSLYEHVHPADRPAVDQLLGALSGSNRVARFEARYRTKGGDYRVIAWNVTLLQDGGDLVFGSGRDVTELRVRNEQERNMAKMEALGALAAGIAHDFNNLLTVILGFTEMTRASLPLDSPVQESLDMVHQAGLRATELTRQINAFGRKEPAKRKPTRLQGLVEEVAKFLRASIPSTIELELFFDPNARPVHVDPNQIHQVILNIATNAFHAIRQKGGIGKILIAVRDVVLESPIGSVHGDVPPGRYVKLSIADDGIGMTPAVVQRIFEPYFTTKGEVGDGTGLGLAVVHGLVRDHGGYIAVQSEPGVGTKFQIFFPALGAGGSVSGLPLSAVAPVFQPGGGKRILLVDDEAAIRGLGHMFLLPLGYQVELAENGAEGLSIFAADPTRFDIVVTDLTMPRVTGRDLARQIREMGSRVPVILITGAHDEINHAALAEAGVNEVLEKPLSRASLVQAIERNLTIADDPAQ